ncbi:MAG: 3-phosphoserine/phosphohydroxythreonine transaminase [Gammaproteobacteria bacterium]|nr:3-phosphoserine/phosphohydroxythreonine transaminase [Gammaproteobacteria bacterium]MDH3466282.1 3-phosphoserine/phosphohydroxythreonine transaminase [Gammaproteobacteria bacterium]
MTKRVHNFCAGPCTLPLEVLEEAQAEFVNYHGSGMSLIEMSHRGKHYDAVHSETMRLALEVYEAPDDFDVLFIQGGATLQFAMVPMNLLRPGWKAGYINSGSWGKGAIVDGKMHGDIYTAWDGADDNYMRMPASSEIQLQDRTRYLHVTSNETIGGVHMVEWPDVEVPLVGDMSSDYMSRPIPWNKFDIVYGGVQKNLGPAGMAIVFVRKAILEDTNRDIARYLRYDVHQDKQSLFNTPPVFAIYMAGKVLNWMQAQGGLSAIEAAAAAKAAKLYGVIDSSGGYYRCPVNVACRSHMNVVFRLPSEELEAKFLADAGDQDLLNLKGHRSVGGCRASIYNAMPMDGVMALCAFMEEYHRANG